jgi:hypothetical protein
MSHKNPIHEAIYKNVLQPALSLRKQSVEGSIMHVDYQNQKVRVYWRDPDSGAERESANVPMPVDGNGVYKQALEEGDRVTLNFKNGNHDNPYISIVHEKLEPVDFESKNGAGVPKGVTKKPNSNGTWQGTMKDMYYSHDKISHESEDAKDYVIKEQEIALKHPRTGAVVKLTDDGLIDVFANDKVGVRINPHNHSVDIFGDSVNITANNFNVKTRSNTTPVKKQKYSDGMITIMKDLGLPVEKA